MLPLGLMITLDECSDSSSRHARMSGVGDRPSDSVRRAGVGWAQLRGGRLQLRPLLYYDVHLLLPAQHPTPFQPPPAYPTEMSSPNGLICFTNCLLPMQDGSLVEKDLWIDERRGVVLDSQVRENGSRGFPYDILSFDVANVLHKEPAAR